MVFAGDRGSKNFPTIGPEGDILPLVDSDTICIKNGHPAPPFPDTSLSDNYL
jgi:hypothetical protein